MEKFLFLVFVFNSTVFLCKRLFSSFSVSLKSMTIKKVGGTTFVFTSQLYALIQSILLYLSVDYIYFRGFYYYFSIISIVGVTLITIVLLVSFLLAKQNKDIPKLENKVNEKSALNRIKDKFIFGFIFRIILGLAWLKTFNYLSININSTYENIMVVFLYLLALIFFMTAILKSKKQNNLDKKK